MSAVTPSPDWACRRCRAKPGISCDDVLNPETRPWPGSSCPRRPGRRKEQVLWRADSRAVRLRRSSSSFYLAPGRPRDMAAPNRRRFAKKADGSAITPRNTPAMSTRRFFFSVTARRISSITMPCARRSARFSASASPGHQPHAAGRMVLGSVTRPGPQLRFPSAQRGRQTHRPGLDSGGTQRTWTTAAPCWRSPWRRPLRCWLPAEAYRPAAPRPQCERISMA